MVDINEIQKPLNVEARYYACYRSDVKEPYALFMFPSEATNFKNFMEKNFNIDIEIKPLMINM